MKNSFLLLIKKNLLSCQLLIKICNNLFYALIKFQGRENYLFNRKVLLQNFGALFLIGDVRLALLAVIRCKRTAAPPIEPKDDIQNGISGKGYTQNLQDVKPHHFDVFAHLGQQQRHSLQTVHHCLEDVNCANFKCDSNLYVWVQSRAQQRDELYCLARFLHFIFH